MHDFTRSQHSRLPAIIIRRRNLNHIRPNNLQPNQPVKYTQQLPRAPPSHLRRPCARRKRRIEHVNVDGNVHSRVFDATTDGVDDAGDADMWGVDGSGADNAEAAAGVVGEVVGCAAVERAAHAGVDAGICVEETFLAGDVEESAVVCAGVGRDATT